MKEAGVTSPHTPLSRSSPSTLIPSPYLLLDVRDSDSYEASHIITG